MVNKYLNSYLDFGRYCENWKPFNIWMAFKHIYVGHDVKCLTIKITRRMSYKMQELLILRGHMLSRPCFVFGGVHSPLVLQSNLVVSKPVKPVSLITRVTWRATLVEQELPSCPKTLVCPWVLTVFKGVRVHIV
jgi:hypothetical protein